MAHKSMLGEFRVLIGAPGHGFGKGNCTCKACEAGVEVGGIRYTIIAFRPDGTFAKCQFVSANRDTRLFGNETLMRVNTGLHYEKWDVTKKGEMELILLNFDEFEHELSMWNDMRTYAGFSVIDAYKLIEDMSV